MDSEPDQKRIFHPAPHAWRDDEPLSTKEEDHRLTSLEFALPSAQDQSRLLELLGLINFKILSGDSLYLEAEGVVYKILYGVYWRSVFTGIEHYLLRCHEINEGMWIEGQGEAGKVDLAIRYTEGGWIVEDCSLKFMIFRDSW